MCFTVQRCATHHQRAPPHPAWLILTGCSTSQISPMETGSQLHRSTYKFHFPVGDTAAKAISQHFSARRRGPESRLAWSCPLGSGLHHGQGSKHMPATWGQCGCGISSQALHPDHRTAGRGTGLLPATPVHSVQQEHQSHKGQQKLSVAINRQKTS